MPRKASKEKKPKEFILKPWLIGQLRRISRRYPATYLCLNAAKEEYFEPSKTGKPMRRVKYKCVQCKNFYKGTNISVDHKEPVVPTEGFPTLSNGEPDWNIFIGRLFCDISNLQVLCDGCHDAKSGTENKARKNARKKKSKT